MRISPAGLELSLTSSRLLSCTNFASKILPYRASAEMGRWMKAQRGEKKKRTEALASGAKGQFYKNTVYFVRDMPYSCFCALF